MSTINRPIEFPGSDEEASANYATHLFYTECCHPDDAADTRCANCDCRPSHVAAEYPCGADVPRETLVCAVVL